MYAFWYNGKNEPRVVVGPDIGFTLLELALVNGIVGLVLSGAYSHGLSLVFWAGAAILVTHNLSFLTTALMNQGLAPRNPNVHSQGYLNSVKTI